MSKVVVCDLEISAAIALSGRVAAIREYIKTEKYPDANVIGAMLGLKKEESQDAGEQDGN